MFYTYGLSGGFHSLSALKNAVSPSEQRSTVVFYFISYRFP